MADRVPSVDTPGQHVTIFVAGSCLHNPGGHSGWSFAIANDCNKGVIKRSGGLRATEGMTNIGAEMVAVVEALKAIPEASNVKLWTNVGYIAKAVNQGYRRVKNLDLWAEIDKQASGQDIEWFSAASVAKHPETLEAHRQAHLEALIMAKQCRRKIANA